MITILKAVRLRRGLTSRAVARAISLDSGYYSRLEGGAAPSPERASQIAAFFGQEVTEHQLLYPDRYLQPVPEPAAGNEVAS